jgi:hypothetical protein
VKTYSEWANEQVEGSNVTNMLFSALQDLAAQCKKWAPTIDRSMAEHAMRQAASMGFAPQDPSDQRQGFRTPRRGMPSEVR